MELRGSEIDSIIYQIIIDLGNLMIHVSYFNKLGKNINWLFFKVSDNYY